MTEKRSCLTADKQGICFTYRKELEGPIYMCYLRAVSRLIYCNEVIGRRMIVNHVSNINIVVTAEIIPYETSLDANATWSWIRFNGVQDIIDKTYKSILIQITLTYHNPTSWMRHLSIYRTVYLFKT